MRNWLFTDEGYRAALIAARQHSATYSEKVSITVKHQLSDNAPRWVGEIYNPWNNRFLGYL